VCRASSQKGASVAAAACAPDTSPADAIAASSACGESPEGPLSGKRVSGRPTLYDVSLDACRAMTGVRLAREAGDPMRASRMESLMETFLWLVDWNAASPVPPQGYCVFEASPGTCARSEP
jgi:hypothetical protein